MTPLLSIITITYNHEPFIAKTIEGVLMQKTSFPIEYIIAEDCSTDGTRAICQQYAEQYPDLIRLITSESNVGAVANERRAMLAARGKYIAFCEGDDYWTDPLKLQKQVDFLESHPDYSVTFHRCKHHNISNNTTEDDRCGFLFKNNELGVEVSIKMFFENWITQPLSMVFRVHNFDPNLSFQYKYYRDQHQIYHLLKSGKGYLFGFYGGVRTRQSSGVFSTLTEKQKARIALRISEELYKFNRENCVYKYYKSNIKWFISESGVIESFPYLWKLFLLDKNISFFIKNIIRIIK